MKILYMGIREINHKAKTEIALYDVETKKIFSFTESEIKKKKEELQNLLKDKIIISWEDSASKKNLVNQIKNKETIKGYSLVEIIKGIIKENINISLEKVAEDLNVKCNTDTASQQAQAIEKVLEEILKITEKKNINELMKISLAKKTITLSKIKDNPKIYEDKIQVLSLANMLKKALEPTIATDAEIISTLTYNSIKALERYRRKKHTTPQYNNEIKTCYLSENLTKEDLQYETLPKIVTDITKAESIILTYPEYDHYIKRRYLPLNICNELFRYNIEELKIPVVTTSWMSAYQKPILPVYVRNTKRYLIIFDDKIIANIYSTNSEDSNIYIYRINYEKKIEINTDITRYIFRTLKEYSNEKKEVIRIAEELLVLKTKANIKEIQKYLGINLGYDRQQKSYIIAPE